MKWFVFSIFTLLFWIGLYLYNHLGVSKEVVVDEFSAPAQLLVFRPHVGAYHKILSVIESVESEFQKLDLICSKTFGQYLDDPGTVDEDRLTSRGGCLFEEPFEPILEKIKATKLEHEILSARKTVRAQFKGSPAIGPLKVYPKLEDFIQEHRMGRSGPIMEVYEIHGERVTTTYLQPVN